VTQLELMPCRIPAKETVSYEILMLLKQGVRLTPIEALNRCACFSLSQRIGELKRMGWPIRTELKQIRPGTRVAEYHLED
jgi:hypothetical protein